MLEIEDIWTTTDRGYEKLACIELSLAKRESMSGNIKTFKEDRIRSIRLFSYLKLIGSMELNVSVAQNNAIKKVYDRINYLTKDIKSWQH